MRSDDRGVTLIELLVTMGVFTVFLALITVSTTQMFGAMRKHQGIADNLDESRNIVLRLDKQFRYANAVIAPGTGTDGNSYVEWRSGNVGQPQTCTQWRLTVSTKQMQYRTWQPPLTGVGTVTASAWTTVADGISAKAGTPVWSLSQSIVATGASTRQQLTVTFLATNGKPSRTSTSQFALTAQNTKTSTAPTGICNEVGRP
jgi:prepilin-type N-terminal cleavage/methylation domain-containing protein